jgi:hypothetical protein
LVKDETPSRRGKCILAPANLPAGVQESPCSTKGLCLLAGQMAIIQIRNFGEAPAVAFDKMDNTPDN